MSKSNLLVLKSDPHRGGDLGNYWHYMFGFFIPASYWFWKNPSLWQGKRIVIDSCNPLTDALMKEYLDHLNIDFEFEEMTEKTIEMTRRDWKSFRKKIWRKFSALERWIRGDQSSWFAYHQLRLKGKTLTLPRWDKFLEQYGDLPAFFKNDLAAYRSFIISLAYEYPNPSSTQFDWLIIKRSAPPTVLEEENGKKARWFSGYGSERRDLRGIDQGVEQLAKSGHTAISLVTGELGLFRQISAFACCKTLVGVRGAEFANMIWMDKDADVYLYMSASFQNEPIQRKLASALGLRFHEIPHEGSISPQLDIQKIFTLMN